MGGPAWRGVAALVAGTLLAGCSSGDPPASAPLTPAQAGELGLLEVPAQADGEAYAARLFYAFRPADEAADGAPIFVIFNGGPNACTTCLLALAGTGPFTIDTNAPVDAPLARNPASWTRFANLLYVDQRQAGFSYSLAGSSMDCTFDAWGDAADYVRVVLGFLDAHPDYRRRRVYLVGESYGATRATLMLYLLSHPNGPEAAHANLSASIVAHLQAVGASNATTQFAGAALFEPFLAGQVQQDLAASLATAAGLPMYVDDTRDVDNDWLFKKFLPRLYPVLARKDLMTLAFGAAVDDVPLLQAAARATAFRVPGNFLVLPTAGLIPVEQALAARLGPLAADDAYYVMAPTECVYNYPDGDFPRAQFLDVARRFPVFVTNAKYDSLLYGPALAPALSDAATQVSVVDGARAGYERLLIHDVTGASPDVSLPFVAYEDSGHMITAKEPAKLAQDLRDWVSGAL